MMTLSPSSTPRASWSAASQAWWRCACAADHEARGVDDDPFLLDVGGLGRKSFHDTAFRNDRRTCLAERGSYTRDPAAVNAVLNIGVRSIVYLSGLIIPLRPLRAGSNTSK